MAEQQVMHSVGAQRCAAEVGKQTLAGPARRLAKPGLQHCHSGFGKRYTPFLSAFPDHMNMSAWTDGDITACQAGHFRLTESGLRRHQEKCVIASSEPCALIGRSEQRLDLRTCEEVHLGPGKALAGNSQHALDLGSVGRGFEGGISKKGVDGGQPQIAAAYTQAPMLLQVIEKSNDQGRVDRLQRKPCRRRVQLLLRERQQHAKSVAVRTDRMWTRLPLLHEALGEKPFQQRSEAGSSGCHDWPSQQRSRRAIACCISSGHALRYQNVSLMWT